MNTFEPILQYLPGTFLSFLNVADLLSEEIPLFVESFRLLHE